MTASFTSQPSASRPIPTEIKASATSVSNSAQKYLHNFSDSLGGWSFGRDDAQKDIPEYTANGLDLPTAPVGAAMTATHNQLGLPGLVNNFCGQVKMVLKEDLDAYATGSVFFRIGTESNNTDNGFQFETTSIAGRIWLLERISGAVGGTPRVQGLSGLVAGSTVDMRFRKSSTTGLALWINGTKNEEIAGTPDYPLPMTWFSLGRRFDTTDTSRAGMELITFRFEPGDLSDAAIEGWA